MKICHVLWELDYGGIETMVVNIANEQSRAGHDIVLLILNDRINPKLKERLDPQVAVESVGRPVGSYNPWYMIRLNRLIAHIKADVFHFHHVNIARYIFKPLMKKWFTTHHTIWRRDLSRYFKENKRLFAISPEVRRDVLEHEGIDSKVIVNGIECDTFEQRPVARNQKPFRIVQVGRLNFAIKGQDITLQAAKRLFEKGYDISIDIIGQGDAAASIDSMIKSLHMESCVRMLGTRTQSYINKHLADYDLLVQPSRIEGFGLTVAEAMAACVPVAVSDLQALVDVVDNGNCGIIFKSDSADACADAIEFAINENTEQMVARARDRVIKEFDVSRTARNYLEAYTE